MLGGLGGAIWSIQEYNRRLQRLRALMLPALARMRQRDAKYWSSRGGATVDEIVLHATESGGTQEQSLNYAAAADDRKVSIHYWIGRDDGLLYSMVPEERAAHHAESHNPRSIGIEMYQLDGFKGDFTDWQYAAVSQLVYDIRWRWHIRKDAVVPHSKLTRQRGDPKNFDWARFNGQIDRIEFAARALLGPEYALS